MEEWRDVVGFEGLYKVSNLGNVLTCKTGRIKKPTAKKDPVTKRIDNMNVLLWANNKCKCMRVHRIVLFAFVGHPPEGMEGCHNDGDATNNNINNLRWDTPANNQIDRVLHGTSNRGERCAASKLTEGQVRAIRADTRSQKVIAKEYGVHPPQISRIKNRLRWAHLD